MEDMFAQNRATIEAVQMFRERTQIEFKEISSRIEEQGKKFDSLIEFLHRMLKAQSEVQAQHGALLVQMNGKLDEHSGKLDEHSGKLDEHSGKLDEHTRKLDEHTRKLDEHTRKLDEHSARFDEQGAKLADHSARLERIEAKLDRKGEAADLAALAERVDRLEKVAAS
jgi:chromosome segregation ATPase